MGRHVNEVITGKWVWKYCFAEQASEQSRIVDEIGVGEMEYPLDRSPYCDEKSGENDKCPDGCEGESCPFNGDILTIDRKEIPRMKEWLEKQHAEDKMAVYNVYMKLQYPSGGIPFSDVEELREWRKENGLGDIYFVLMVKAYVGFMEQHPEIDQFSFEGEY